MDRFLGSDQNFPNQIVSWFIVFLADCGDIEGLTNYYPKLIKKKQNPPPKFRRSLEEFYFDYILSWSNRELDKGHSPRPFFTSAYTRLNKNENLSRITPVLQYKLHAFEAKLRTVEADHAMSREDIEKEGERLYQCLKACYIATQVYHKPRVKTVQRRAADRLVKLGFKELIKKAQIETKNLTSAPHRDSQLNKFRSFD